MDDSLTHVLAELRERFESDASSEEVEAFLSSRGFDRRQIGEIIALFCADGAGRRIGAAVGDATLESSILSEAEARGRTFRVQGPHERGRFSPEAWGYLLALGGSRLVTPDELEHIIERALVQIDGRISFDELRALLEGAGLGDLGTGADHTTVH